MGAGGGGRILSLSVGWENGPDPEWERKTISLNP